MLTNDLECARMFFHYLLNKPKKSFARAFFNYLCALFLRVARVFLFRWRVWRIIFVLFAPMSLETFDVRVKSAAAFERYFLHRTSAHFEKRLRQRRTTIVCRLRQLRETALDGSRQTWPRNYARQLVCVFFFASS